VIDVEESRFQFTAATTTNQTADDGTTSTKKVDEATYTIANTAGTNGVANTTQTAVVGSPTAISIELPYDATWLDSDATTAGVQLTNTSDINHVITGALGATVGTVTISTAGDKITLAETASPPTILGQANFLSIESSIAKTAIPVATFSPTATLTYTSNSTPNYNKTLTPATAFGSWTLNGASITAFGVPYGSAVTRFLWVNNAGATAGEVSGSLTLGGTTYGPYALGSAAAKSSTEVGKLLDSALATAGVTIPESSRGNVTITVPVKASDVTMSSAYKHNADADRLTIDNSND
jgi:hypothetical protein